MNAGSTIVILQSSMYSSHVFCRMSSMLRPGFNDFWCCFGWTDERVEELIWMNGWTDERLEEFIWMNGWTDEPKRMNGWTEENLRNSFGWTDERMNDLRNSFGWTDERMNDLRTHLDERMNLTVPVPVRSNYDLCVWTVRNNYDLCVWLFQTTLWVYWLITLQLQVKKSTKSKTKKSTKNQRLNVPHYRIYRNRATFSYFRVFLQFSRHLGALVHTSAVLNEFRAFSRCNNHYRLIKMHFQFW